MAGIEWTHRTRRTRRTDSRAVEAARRRRAAVLSGSVALGLVLALAAPAPVWAQAGHYTPARKAGRGAAGLFLGVLEIPGNIVAETRRNGPIRGATIGTIMGVGMLIVRSGVGLWELCSAPWGLPNDFQPLIDPEFPWDYFTEAEDRSPSYSDEEGW